MKKLFLVAALCAVTNVFAQSVVTVNPDRTVSVNGSKFFPISVYLQSDWAGAKNLGINTASRPFCANLNALAQCEANALYGHLTVGPGCDAENAQSIRDRNATVFTNSINQHKNSNYVLGYGLPDEPISANNLNAADTKWAYDLFKSKDPNHLVFLTDYARDISAHKNSADVFLNDLYPFNNISNPMYEIKTRFKNMVDQVAPKPAWLIIQTGSQFGVPTNAQIRAETYLSIVLGSTGVIFYSYDVSDAGGVHNIKKDGDPAFMKNLITELKSFSPYFLGATSNKLSYTSADVDALLKEQGGKLYLIAVNKNAAAKSISFTVTGSANATARIIGTASAGSTRAGQSLTLTSSGVLTDVLQGLEAVVYEIGTTTTTNGDGLTANYFNGTNFETPVHSRVDPTVNFNWGNGSPNTAVNADRFSVRWSGQIQPQYTETYTFHVNSDNGRRLWINNQLIVDKWVDDWGTEYSGTIALTGGQKYNIRLEHFENTGGAACKLEWSSPSQSKQVVPETRLYSNALPSVSLTSPANNANVNAGNLTITANASDNGSIAKVEFFNGNTLLGTSTTAPYSYTWNAPAGTYNLNARATDNLGAVKVSSTVTVIVKTVTVNQPPVVSLTAPANGTTYNAPASISITADASDADGSIAKVEFYKGSVLLVTRTASPYTYNWSNVAAGTYNISAKAYDNSGTSASSAAFTVVVKPMVTDACSGVAQYAENNAYVAGSTVKNAGKRYQCKEWPYSGWCNGAAWAYAPGTGAYWSDAWYDRGTCSARTGNETTTEELLLVPNPVVDQLTLVSAQDLTGGKVSILDALGVEVLRVDTYGSSIDVSSLASGAYVILWSKGDRRIARHFTK